MIRRTSAAGTALAAALALGLAFPVAAQPGQGTNSGEARQGGPNGSSAGPIAPQVQAVQQSLLAAEQQLSRSQTERQPPNYDQSLRAVMAGQDTVAEMRSAGGGRDTRALQDAERELAGARRLLETAQPELRAVIAQLRTAANAITAINAGATGATTAPGPASGGVASDGRPR